jgi:4-methylaminobutanoate oxidase (methylamine-forming)
MRVAVIGAGLAGLACAVDLARAEVDVTVFEARDRVGGRAWSARMPDGSRFERGGEFIEAGYHHFRRRAAEYRLPLVPQGFAFAAREVRSAGRSLPALLPEAEETLATVVRALGPAAADASAAEALARAPLEPLARLALLRRLEGTYTVELDRVSASWLANAELRAGACGDREASARLAAGNDALARALAAELGERVRLGCPIGPPSQVGGAVEIAAAGASEHYERAVLAVPLPLALGLVPALRDRPGYSRLVWGVASKLHVPLAEPATPAAVQGLDAAFWTWTAAGADGETATIAASFAGGSRADEALELAAGSDHWRTAIGALRPELALTGTAVLTRWRDETHTAGAYACHPPGWSQRDDEEIAAPHGRIHLAGEHTAAEYCGTLEGGLRSGARAAAEVLAERAQIAIAH